MTVDSLLKALEYDRSPRFLHGDRLDSVHSYSHVFRKASRSCSLTGVYVLAQDCPPAQTATPAVYVCTADSIEQADTIHKNVWNQNIVPFLIISTPHGIRLYSGFRYDENGSDADPQTGDKGILANAIQLNEVADRLRGFHASAIDDGHLWREWGAKIDLESRLDRRLLNKLKALDVTLQEMGASKAKSHSLIGKYVYLRYLRDRDIISNRRLEQWQIGAEDVFGRNARIEALQNLLGKLEQWLNGSVFPLNLDPRSDRDASYLKKVASIFKGDEPTGQMHLNFEAYDFSYIPIEMLSVIYEQFLHSTGTGRDVGAYYTPLPLVNFMLEELDDRRQLLDGMKVLDPACGSGAFLVQCYRRLIEREIRTRGTMPPPERLHELLTANIYGIDQDPDACAVAELSLILTLLDYVNPPDLQDYGDSFKLPSLRNSNIFVANFFDDTPPWQESRGTLQFQWIIGNPPWKEVDKKRLLPHEHAAVAWMETHRRKCPVGRLQLAEAFAWK